MSGSQQLRRRPRVSARSGAALTLTALAALLTFPLGFAAHATSARAAVAGAVKRPAYGTIWATAQSTQSLLEFAPGATTDAAPIADINGAATELNNPTGLAIDHQGRLWVANSSAAMILVFAANATGNVAPVMTIVGAKTGLNEPMGIALTQRGDLWVANSGSNTLAEFAAGANGNIAPIRTIAGSNTLLANLTGLAVSPDGTRVWVSEVRKARAKVPPILAEFAGTANGNVKPLTQISGKKTHLDAPYGIAVGVKGNDPVTDDTNVDDNSTAILKFAPGAHGNAAPKMISGGETGLSAPRLLALDAVGGIWVPNSLSDLIFRFGPSQLGNVGPSYVLVGSSDSLDTPGSVAVFIAPPTVPRAVHAHDSKKTLRLTWSAPHVTGGGILGYLVRRAHKKSGPWQIIATTTKRSFRSSHPHKGRYYEIEAFNNAGISVATHPSRPKI